MNVNTTLTASAKAIDSLHQYHTVVENSHLDGLTPCLIDLSEENIIDFSEDDIIDLSADDIVEFTWDGPQPVQSIKSTISTTTQEWMSLLKDQCQEAKETKDYRGGLQDMRKWRNKEEVIELDGDTHVCEIEDEDEAPGAERAMYQEYEPTAYHDVGERIDSGGHEMTALRQDYILREDDLAGSDEEVDEKEGEDTLLDYGRVQILEAIEPGAKHHNPADEAVEIDDGGDGDSNGYEMAVAAMVFDDKNLDLLFNRIARLYEQLPTRVAQDMLPYMFTSPAPFASSASSSSSSSTLDSINSGDSTTTTSSVTAQPVRIFFQASKTVSQLWKRWFISCHASELRPSIWMLEVYFKNWKKKTLVTKKQKEVFEVEKRVVRSVLKKVRDSEGFDEMLMQDRGSSGGGIGRRRGSGTHADVGGGATLKERVESAKEAIEADVVREGGMRRYHDELGLADGIAWKLERCPQIYIKHKV